MPSWSSHIESAFEPDDLDSNPARSAGYNRVITVGRLLTYSCLALRIHSNVPPPEECQIKFFVRYIVRAVRGAATFKKNKSVAVNILMYYQQ